jgi:hypothetical protein
VVNRGVGITGIPLRSFWQTDSEIRPAGHHQLPYDGATALDELDGAGNILARYTQDPGIDEPFAELRSGTTSY